MKFKITNMLALFLSLFALSLVLFRNNRASKERRQMILDEAISRYPLDSNTNEPVAVDSIHIKGDTIFYYKSRAFAGMTVITEE